MKTYFNEKDYEEPVYLAYYLRSLARNIGIDLEMMKDRLYRDGVESTGKEISLYWRKKGVRHTENDIINCCHALNSVCEWTRYKKIYDFHPAFVDYLKDTEDSPIYSEVFSKLPFQSFYINLGKFKSANESGVFGESIRGMFIRVFPGSDCVYIGITIETEMKSGEWCFLSHRVVVKNGETIQETLQDVQKEENREIYKGIDLDKVEKDWSILYRIAINACQYLCASNAEIRDVKIPKGKRPVAKIDGKTRPVSIQKSEVGFRIGEKFESMYRERNEFCGNSGKCKIRMRARPHVRRAHWHHYWTGVGKKVLELRWLEPVFVMGNSNKIDIVSHEVIGVE